MNRMFHYLRIIVLGFIILSCNTANKENEAITTDLINIPASATGKVKDLSPMFEFEMISHDFGNITQGEKVSFSFKFNNVGNSNLIISTATGSCGCTVPEYPKKPIVPGEQGVVNVIFDSEGRSGKMEKSVTILANTNPASTELKISGNIIVPQTEFNQLKTNN